MDWLIAGALTIIINVILFAVLSNRLHKQYNTQAFLEAARREMDLLMTEMNQSAERNVAVFEDRVQKLRLLLDEMDRKMVLARKELSQQEQATVHYGHVRAQMMDARRQSIRPEEIPPEPFAEQPVESRLPRREVPEREPQVIPASKPSAPAQALAKTQARDELRRKVLALHRSGLDSTMIAQRAGISLGEVDLIISIGENS